MCVALNAEAKPRIITRWCCVCGHSFQVKDIPTLTMDAAFCDDVCISKGGVQMSNKSTWHPLAKANDPAYPGK